MSSIADFAPEFQKRMSGFVQFFKWNSLRKNTMIPVIAYDDDIKTLKQPENTSVRYIRLIFVLLIVLVSARISAAENDFRIYPYLQNPSQDAMTVIWFSVTNTPGSFKYFEKNTNTETALSSNPELASALIYPAWENDTFFDGKAPAPPYRHRVRLTGLKSNTMYLYSVEQNGTQFSSSFKTAPDKSSPIRLIVYSDSETEPESTGKHTLWTDPEGKNTNRTYLIDQTLGYTNNLELLHHRQPDIIAIAGDLVESGGEQRDWDEFWHHITGSDGEKSLAGRVPFIAAPGNHEYYEGPSLGRYNPPGSEQAIGKYLEYFEFPANNAPDEKQEDRYYRLDYGPVTLISLDVANNSPHRSGHDTNFFLLGENDPNGGGAPAFSPDSHQYLWLETQLRDAQAGSRFTFVMFHHIPYSVGPHGWPAGEGDGHDTQSGVPVRTLVPLLIRYGVDAIFAGHDEMMERSEISGMEMLADGSEKEHILHIYDVGTGGDGLRGPQNGLDNPYQKFLAHTDSPEISEDGRLIDGGKHYGHIEVDVLELSDGLWQAVFKPVYVFPLFDDNGVFQGYERRLYDDVVTLTDKYAGVHVSGDSSLPGNFGLEIPFPNPFNSTVLLRYTLPEASSIILAVYDFLGRKVRRLREDSQPPGYYSVEWDGRDEAGTPVGSGIYLIKLQAGSFSDSVKVTLVK